MLKNIPKIDEDEYIVELCSCRSCSGNLPTVHWSSFARGFRSRLGLAVPANIKQSTIVTKNYRLQNSLRAFCVHKEKSIMLTLMI